MFPNGYTQPQKNEKKNNVNLFFGTNKIVGYIWYMNSKQQNFLKTSLPKKFKGGESEFIIFDMALEYKSLLHEPYTNCYKCVGKKIDKVSSTSNCASKHSQCENSRYFHK
jgi:hypothetical protein